MENKELEALEKVNNVLESVYEYEKKTGKNAIVHISKEPLIEIQQALQRLKAIDNAIPSEALKLLKETKRRYFNFEYGHTQQYIDHWKNLIKTLDVVEQALLKAQEQESENKALLEENNDLYAELTLGGKQYKELTECVKQYKKALEIVIKKEVHTRHFSEEIKQLGKKFTYEFYLLEFDNYHYFDKEENKLTEEEFDLLKRYFEKWN